MERGFVKWSNDQKPYGFIRREDGGDVFINGTVLQRCGYNTLSEGQAVEIDTVSGIKGASVNTIAVVG